MAETLIARTERPAAPAKSYQSLLAQLLATPNGRMLFDRLVRSQERRVGADLGALDLALREATSPTLPNRRNLLALYRDAMRDAHLAAAVELRRNKLLMQPFEVVDAAGRERPELSAKLGGLPMRRLIAFTQEAVLWGHSLIEIWLGKDGTPERVELLPREHVRPEWGEYMPNLAQPSEVIKYRGRRATQQTLLMEVGDPYDLGLLEQAVKCYLLKQMPELAWVEFTEVFGLPTRHVKFMGGQTDDDRQKVVNELQAAGLGAVTSGDQSMEVQFLETEKTDAYQTFERLMVYQDEKISQLVLGQNLTQSSGQHGSRALGEVHERVSNYITDADKRLVEAEVNRQLLPALAGPHPEWAGVQFRYRVYESMPQKDRVGMIELLYRAGLEVDAEQVSRELGLNLRRVSPPAAAAAPAPDAGGANA